MLAHTRLPSRVIRLRSRSRRQEPLLQVADDTARWPTRPQTRVFRGTRMPVAAVFENLEDGMTIDEIVRLYDGLTREQVQSVLEFAARSLEVPALAG
ncbi:MAG: DUF433 domain-containing protein [Acidobacteria bacterium]|nr:DUF433 domain-containing protein [Acidobacteriota bacterium]